MKDNLKDLVCKPSSPLSRVNASSFAIFKKQRQQIIIYNFLDSLQRAGPAVATFLLTTRAATAQMSCFVSFSTSASNITLLPGTRTRACNSTSPRGSNDKGTSATIFKSHKKNIVKCFKNHHYQGLKHQAPKQDHASELEGKVHSCAEKVEEKKMGNSALQHARQRNRELVTFSDSIFEVGRSTASLSSANTGRIGDLLKELCCFKVTLKQVVCMSWCLLAGREQGSAVSPSVSQ